MKLSRNMAVCCAPVLLVLVASVVPAAVAGDGDFVALAAWTNSAAGESGRLRAGGSELLAVDDDRMRDLLRWVRRGGELRLVGDAIEPALRRIDPGLDATVTLHEVGLGWVSLGDDPLPDTVVATSDTDLLESGGRYARALLPDSSDRRFATAARLTLYALLLAAGFAATRATSSRWRVVGALSLVAVFATWSVWSVETPLGADRWSQVDVAVDVGSGSVMLWSAVALDAGTRHRIALPEADSTWAVRVLDRAVAPAASGRVSLHPGDPLDIVWLDESPRPGRLAVSVSRVANRLTGLLHNDAPNTWNDVWLLLPEDSPQPLDPIGANETRLLDQPLRQNARSRLDTMAGIPAGPRRKLVEAAIEHLVEPLLARDRPVLVAWSDRPFGPIGRLRGRRVAGSTLLIRIGEVGR